MIHITTNKIVNTLATQLIPGLLYTFPSSMTASVSPAFGNMNAHQFKVKLICRIPAITATVEMQKNQKEKSITKPPATNPIICTILPSAKVLSPLNAIIGSTFGAWLASEINAADV